MINAKKSVLLSLATLILAQITVSPGFTQGLVSKETADQRLLYIDPLQTFLAPHAARCFQNSLATHQRVLGFSPDEPATIFLRDFSDYGNASATGVPRNTLIFDIAPLNFTFETFATSERMCGLMNHELVHVIASDQATTGDQRARRFFGGKVAPVDEHPETIFYSWMTNPRIYAPRWYHEGIAVFMETWMAGGLGRAQGAYDEMVFRSMVRDDAYFYDPLGLESEGTQIDFQVGVNYYLYGTRFLSYVAYTYSPEKLVEWIRRKEGSKSHYSAQFEHVFGLPMADAWQDWIDFEREFQTRNLEAVRKFPITEYDDLSDRGLGSVSRAFFEPDSGKLHWALRYPGVVAHIGNMSIDDGTIRNLIDVKGPMLYSVTSLAFDAESQTLFYTADNYAFRDVMSLDLETGEARTLLKDARIGGLVFNKSDRSLWGVRHMSGIATLVRMPFPYEEWNQIHSFPYGEVLYDLDISPDGRLLSTSFGEPTGEQSLRVYETESLLQEVVSPVHQFDFGQAVPESFVFSPDGKYLFGSSYFTGISNIFRYELATEDLQAVSNAEAGFFRPVPREDGSLIVFRYSLIVFRYSGQGFVPTIIDPEPLEDVSAISFFGSEIVKKYPELQTWQVGSPADVPLDEMITNEGPYSGFGNIGLQSIFPVLEGYKDEFALGLSATFTDPLMLDRIDISVSHSIDSDLPSGEDIHAKVEWRHVVTRQTPLSGTWRGVLRHNAADFYDLFGPTKRSRKGQSATLEYDKTLIYDQPRQLDLNLGLSHYMNMDQLPRYQNIDVAFDDMTTLHADLNYSHVRKSLGAVDDEKGFKWRVITAATNVDGDNIPKVFGNFDFGFALPWSHSSIWLRNSAGLAIGDVDDPFANFFFGGFGNNYVDRGEVKRYRHEYALPGFELNEIGGRNFFRSMVEWNLPPIRFRNVGGDRFFLTWARPAIFATTLVTNVDNSSLQRNVSSVGAQLDFRFTLLSRLDMTFSMGYAVGFGDDVVGSPDEFMLSLKIL
jgi:hypothetical protein